MSNQTNPPPTSLCIFCSLCCPLGGLPSRLITPHPRLSLIPAPLSAIALNIIGSANLLLQIAQARPHLKHIPQLLHYPLVLLSILLQLLFLLRVVVYWRGERGSIIWFAQRELASTRVTSSYGAFFMAAQMAAAHLEHMHHHVATLVHVASWMQYIVCGYFLACCISRRKLPEPFWFPATASIATPALVGSEVGTHTILQVCWAWGLSLWLASLAIGMTAFPCSHQVIALVLGITVTTICWPICVWRIFTHKPERTRKSPTHALSATREGSVWIPDERVHSPEQNFPIPTIRVSSS